MLMLMFRLTVILVFLPIFSVAFVAIWFLCFLLGTIDLWDSDEITKQDL